MYCQLLLYREKGDKISGSGTNYIYLGKKLIAKYGDVTPQTLNESRQHARPFGESIEAPKDDVGYTGHKFDTDLGLSYMQARYYDPVIGRFYSNDPVDAVSHLSNEEGIKGFNRYSYAVNNPYKYTDPDGKTILNPATGAGAGCALTGPACPVGAVVGGLVGTVALILTVDLAIDAFDEMEDNQESEDEEKNKNNQFAKRNKKEKNKDNHNKRKTQRGRKNVRGDDPEKTKAEEKADGDRGSRDSENRIKNKKDGDS